MRRTRFTVYFTPDQEPQVILAYHGQENEIRDYYEKRGYAVRRVVKGDHRKKQRAAAKQREGGFRIDRKALNAAIDALGLDLPVDIRFHARVGSTNGNYRFDGRRHDIMLKSYLTPEQASSTLWHELTHAMQAERAGATTAAWSSVQREQARWSYWNRPIEREARQMSEDMRDCPLTY